MRYNLRGLSNIFLIIRGANHAMSTAAMPAGKRKVDEQTYRRRIRAWILYDWANSAFVTTVLAAVLPVYYSSVAGATLPSAATATAYWSLTNSFALIFVAFLSPILGTISDVIRGKKIFLSIFVTIGVIGAGLLTMVSTGDWLLASVLVVIGRIGFSGANVFYDALLPHVAAEEDRDRVSTSGFAFGYLGGGILLAINVVMLQTIPEAWFANAGIRLSFLSVALWWALFSIPIFRVVPEPRSAQATLQPGETVIGVSFRRIRETFADLRQYSELFRYLVAFLIYSDAINTIIGLAAIYGAELGFQTLELVLALLLVQFVGVPFSLIFGSLPTKRDESRRHYYLAFILFSAVMLPIVAIGGRFLLPADITGQPPAPYVTEGEFVGEGLYAVDESAIQLTGEWELRTITSEEQVGAGLLGRVALLFSPPDEVVYAETTDPDAFVTFPMNGEQFTIRYASGNDRALLGVRSDGEPVTTVDTDDVEVPLTIDMFDEILRFGNTETVTLPKAGPQTVTLVPQAGGTISITTIQVLPPTRTSDLGLILGVLLAVQLVGIGFAVLTGRLFRPLAERLDTRRSILLSLVIYGIIAVLGFFLNTTIEFWFLAWMVAIVQGGSQALSRSLYASLCPSSKSGEFFGLFSILSKFASIIGPLLFAAAVAFFGSSRPALLSLILLFALGGFLLTRVNIAEGLRVAREEDAEWYDDDDDETTTENKDA